MPRDADGLTVKQARFKALVMSGVNQTKAYIQAGYASGMASAPFNASRLANSEKMRKVLAKAQETAAGRAGITAERVLKRIDTVADRCMQAEEVLDSKGLPTGEYRFDSTGANRSLELLGRHLRLFEGDGQGGGNGGGNHLHQHLHVDFGTISADERAQWLERLRARTEALAQVEAGK
jgi:phage terminase small subunit